MDRKPAGQGVAEWEAAMAEAPGCIMTDYEQGVDSFGIPAATNREITKHEEYRFEDIHIARTLQILVSSATAW